MEMYLENHYLANGIVIVVPLFLFLYYRLAFREKRDGFIKFIRRVMLPFTLFGGFVIYAFGYQYGKEFSDALPNALEAIFSTGRLFILGNDLVEVGCIKKTFVYHACFSLIAASAVFVFASIVLHIFFKDYLERRKIRRSTLEENHFFFGINQATLSLAQDLLKPNNNKLVVFVKDVDKNENQALYHHAKEAGAFVIKRESLLESIHLEKEEGIAHVKSENKSHETEFIEDSELFHNLELIRKRLESIKSHLYFLSESEDWNLFMAQKAISEMKRWQLIKDVRVHVETFSESTDKLYFSWAQSIKDGISVQMHNHSAITARQLISVHNPVDSIEVDSVNAVSKSDFNVLVVGFGQTGCHILRKLIEHGQFVGSRFHATVVDKSMNSKKGRFECLYPGAISNYDLDFVETEVGRSEFYELIRKKIKSLNYVVVALGNDKLNMQTAQDIQELTLGLPSRRFKIMVQIKSNNFYQNLYENMSGDIHVFGRNKEIYTEKIIVQGIMEKRARRIHEVYNLQSKPKDRMTFGQINRIMQLSNISAAEHIYNKLVLSDMTEEKVKKYENKDNFLTDLNEKRKMNLAKGEHLHWNAFYFSNGWTTLNLKDISASGERKNELTKQHVCLVDWNDLPNVGKHFGKDFQKYDIDTVENMFEFIQE